MVVKLAFLYIVDNALFRMVKVFGILIGGIINMNLKNLQIELIDGSFVEKDVSKEVANLIYQNVTDIGMLDVAMTLYKTGEVEMDENQK